ncbi:Rrf2 family transcriptional regulator [Halococcus thailandensis]|uniref:Transcriptional regulator n=1 Tax=Halococcus thailandensis JCM 13552 TaxID=1227457 RepID=M0NA85_9EURY|nr:Rrf2 family transcriptional regulator [Halococcus thailandensis]EMA53545.1 transcriptional regulator [Halococcus thailandensis JCM 13552]
MSSIASDTTAVELTDGQTATLRLLIDCYRERDTAVKVETVVGRAERDPTTVRSQLRNLKALQLVRGISGPKGGYKPTGDAYGVLDRQTMDDVAAVPLSRNGERIEHVNVEEIDLISVRHPERCLAEVRVQGVVRDVRDGDTVTVGPTPQSRLTIRGSIDDVDGGVLVIDVEKMDAPAND